LLPAKTNVELNRGRRFAVIFALNNGCLIFILPHRAEHGLRPMKRAIAGQ